MMLQQMTMAELFRWQQYFRQHAERTDRELARDEARQKTPEEMTAILQMQMRGGIGA